MRAVVQRVLEARVTVAGRTVAELGHGLVVLLGIGEGDGEAEAKQMAARIAGLRMFDDGAGKMNLSVVDCGGAVLLVSQFTLYGDCRKGRRPSFTRAAPPEVAEPLYGLVAEELRARGLQVETGVFKEHMAVALVNDGPVTLLLDSQRIF